jgi:hypothetical protein
MISFEPVHCQKQNHPSYRFTDLTGLSWYGFQAITESYFEYNHSHNYQP